MEETAKVMITVGLILIGIAGVVFAILRHIEKNRF